MVEVGYRLDKRAILKIIVLIRDSCLSFWLSFGAWENWLPKLVGLYFTNASLVFEILAAMLLVIWSISISGIIIYGYWIEFSD